VTDSEPVPRHHPFTARQLTAHDQAFGPRAALTREVSIGAPGCVGRHGKIGMARDLVVDGVDAPS